MVTSWCGCRMCHVQVRSGCHSVDRFSG